jgi:hypothetical protein
MFAAEDEVHARTDRLGQDEYWLGSVEADPNV